ncbi:hypothetical protein OG864_20960 [Streptomyces sp. NBC_00124]|nr:hypothetical protein [Streptomyces sp. NBC_00124]MCX5361182.1 hypothetical protein [Streptomyces sp. NBC_00124]
MTTPHDSTPKALRHRPVATAGAIAITAPDENRPRLFRGRARQVGRT